MPAFAGVLRHESPVAAAAAPASSIASPRFVWLIAQQNCPSDAHFFVPLLTTKITLIYHGLVERPPAKGSAGEEEMDPERQGAPVPFVVSPRRGARGLSAAAAPTTPKVVKPSRRGTAIALALGLVVIAAIAYNTKVVHLDGGQGGGQQAFAPDKFGQDQFPRIRISCRQARVDAQTLGPAVLADKAAAIKQYGTRILDRRDHAGQAHRRRRREQIRRLRSQGRRRARRRSTSACRRGRRSTAPTCAMRPATSSSSSSRTRSSTRTPAPASTGR